MALNQVYKQVNTLLSNLNLQVIEHGINTWHLIQISNSTKISSNTLHMIYSQLKFSWYTCIKFIGHKL